MTHIFLHRRGTAGTTLFIHGFLGSGQDWQETIAGLASDDTCYTLDLPSHGDAGEISTRLTSFEDVIIEIGTALKKECPDPLHGIGYSLGGRILLGLTHRYPELFSRLTLVSTFPGFQDNNARDARWESDLRWSELLRTLDTETFLARWYEQETSHCAQWNDQPRARILSSRSSLSLPRLASFFEATSAAKMPNYWPLLSSLSIPTTFVVGERDQKYMRIGEELTTRNPNIRLVILPECGHAIPLEAPETLAKTLSN
jgi:2-succinyl-6-hydroxy-2,4-cyclohexadiene-1-carboxylate synthase